MTERVLRRGDVWFADFSPTRGHEQGGRRPALIISSGTLNQGRSRLVALIPITSRDRRIAAHVPLVAPEGGVDRPSFILCDQLRIATQERLERHLGTVTPATLAEVENWLKIFLGL